MEKQNLFLFLYLLIKPNLTFILYSTYLRIPFNNYVNYKPKSKALNQEEVKHRFIFFFCLFVCFLAIFCFVLFCF